MLKTSSNYYSNTEVNDFAIQKSNTFIYQKWKYSILECINNIKLLSTPKQI